MGNVTSEVCGQLSITEPACRFVSNKVSTVRREIGLDKGKEVVIVASINYGVPHYAKCRNKWFPTSHIENHHGHKKGTQNTY